jgi:hypothetical protein
MELVVDKNIPIPRLNHASQNGQLAEAMDYGDSILFSNRRDNHRDMLNFQATLRRHGFRSVSRKEENGYRVWKRPKRRESEAL